MDAQQIADMNRNADLATCCLTMVSIVVKMPSVDTFTVYAMPWNWLETCKNLSESGAEWLAAHAPRNANESWLWMRPEKPGKRSRRATGARRLPRGEVAAAAEPQREAA